MKGFVIIAAAIIISLICSFVFGFVGFVGGPLLAFFVFKGLTKGNNNSSGSSDSGGIQFDE